ncbi:MAG: hypothetical protein M1826_000231 [Phylliscum demangeonii]|nr:MAG: hypothetical protein M1826_000231 [Phylliscum demangeonii]
MSRPEDTLPAELYYNDHESRKYTRSSRMQAIQASMTSRALTLLALATPSLILDIGCGSGLSGAILASTRAADGGPHTWIGMDVSGSMLATALQRADSDSAADGDLLLADIGQGIPFRPGSFDAAISISAIQWLCNADRSDVSAHGRLARFFAGLYAALKRGARAVCQFYPKNGAQREMICAAAVKAGFGAGVLEDDPGTKNVKLYLVLTVGGGAGDITRVVRGLEGVEVVDDQRGKAAARSRGASAAVRKGSRKWIVKKKEQMERKGKVVKPSSRYTGRNRRPKF